MLIGEWGDDEWIKKEECVRENEGESVENLCFCGVWVMGINKDVNERRENMIVVAMRKGGKIMGEKRGSGWEKEGWEKEEKRKKGRYEE